MKLGVGHGWEEGEGELAVAEFDADGKMCVLGRLCVLGRETGTIIKWETGTIRGGVLGLVPLRFSSGMLRKTGTIGGLVNTELVDKGVVPAGLDALVFELLHNC